MAKKDYFERPRRAYNNGVRFGYNEKKSRVEESRKYKPGVERISWGAGRVVGSTRFVIVDAAEFAEALTDKISEKMEKISKKMELKRND